MGDGVTTIDFTCPNCGGERDGNVWSVSVEPVPSRWLIGCPACGGRMVLASSQHGSNTAIHGCNTGCGVGSLAECRWCKRTFIRAKENQQDCCKPCHDAYGNARKKAEHMK